MNQETTSRWASYPLWTVRREDNRWGCGLPGTDGHDDTMIPGSESAFDGLERDQSASNPPYQSAWQDEIDNPFGFCPSRGIIMNDDDTVGIDKIDKQHRFLAGLYNNLLQNLCAEISSDRCLYIFTEMFSYANFHFSFEEQLMRRTLYPEYRAHLFEHRNLISTLELLHRRISQHDDTAIILARIIGQWLLCHIRIADKDLGLYLVVDSALDSLNVTAAGAPASPADGLGLAHLTGYRV